MGEVTALADRLPAWVLVLVAVAVVARYLGQMVAEASESWSRVLGPLGRRWREQAQRRRGRGDVVLEDLRHHVDYLAGRVDELMADARKRDERDRERDRREHDRDRYLAYLIRCLRAIERWAAQQQVDLPGPMVLSIDEWLAAGAQAQEESS